MSKVIVSIRFDKPLIDEIRRVIKEMNKTSKEKRTFSGVIRDLMRTFLMIIYPSAQINSSELIEFIKSNSKDDKIYAWKIIQFISPRAIKSIENIIEESRKLGLGHSNFEDDGK